MSEGVARRSPRRSFVLLLLLWTASVGLAVALLVVLEVTAGLFVEPLRPREIPGDAVSRTVTYIEVNPAPLVRDAELLWRNEPGARKTQPVNPRHFGRRDAWTIENNSAGYRGPEVLPPSSDGDVFRILCIGDSITFGFSVDQGDTYPEQLRVLLEQRYPRVRFEIVNTGVPGWSWLQGLRFLDLEGLGLEPDVVVIGHGTNDQLFPAKMTDEERLLRLATPMQRFAQRAVVFAAETNLFRAAQRAMPERPQQEESPGCRRQALEHGACRRVSIDEIAASVREVHRITRKAGVDLLVANTDFVQTAAVRGVRKGAEDAGADFVDLVAEAHRRRRDDEDARARRLGLSLASAKGPETATRKVVLRVAVPAADRKYRFEGSGYFRPDVVLAGVLVDDGTQGDERSGDGVLSATIEVPPGIGAVQYKYFQGDTPEFEPLPPLASTLGDRVLHVAGSGFGPVDEFGRSLFMVERAHPDRAGHALIASLVAERIERMPAFRSYTEGAGGTQGGESRGHGSP